MGSLGLWVVSPLFTLVLGLHRWTQMVLQADLRTLVGVWGVTIAAMFVAFSPPTAAANLIYFVTNEGSLEVRDILPPQGTWPVVQGDTFGNWNANVGEGYGPTPTSICFLRTSNASDFPTSEWVAWTPVMPLEVTEPVAWSGCRAAQPGLVAAQAIPSLVSVSRGR